MAQITWRNIDAPDLTRATIPLAAAQRGFDNSFSQLGNVLQQYATGRMENNTQAFQDALAQYRTPEEMQAAMASGAIDKLRAQFGNNIDRTVARDAPQKMLEAAMINRKVGQEYAAYEKALVDAPILDQHKQLIATGNYGAAEQLRKNNPGVMFGNAAVQEREFKQGDSRFNDQRAQNAANLVGTNLLNESRGISNETAAMDLQDTKSDRNIRKVIEAAVPEVQKARDASELDIGNKAKVLGLPTLPNGYADRTAIANDADYTDVWNKNSNVLGNINPSFSDTAAYAQKLREAVQNKELTQEEANHAYATSPFDARPKLQGNDAVAAANAKIAQENEDKYFDETSFAAPGSPDAQRNAAELADYAAKMVPDADERAAVTRKISELSSKGVRIKIGNEWVNVNPPMQIMKNMINQSVDEWGFWRDRGNNLEKQIEQWAKDNQGTLMQEWEKRKARDNRKKLQGVASTNTR